MELMVSEELEELREGLRRFFGVKSSSSEVRRVMGTGLGYDPAVWGQMAGQLGLQGLAVPEELGGSGFGMREVAVVMEEMGRALVCAPFLSSAVLGAEVLLGCGDRELLPQVADGSLLATLAWMDGDDWDLGAVQMEARQDNMSWVLDGVKSYVLDGHIAGVVLVAAQVDGKLALFLVDGDAEGLTKTRLTTLDQTRRLARLEFHGVKARLVERDARPVLERALDLAAVALAAEQLGGAQKVLELTIDYVKVRHQFGRPIGSFQAIKHRCADMFVLVESARSAVLQAAAVADERPEELPAAAALAKSYCSDAFFHVAGETIQLHGGIGFTWEHDAHLYFKRAKASQEMFGPPSRQREKLAKLVGIGP